MGFLPHQEPLYTKSWGLALFPLEKASKDTASAAGKAGPRARSPFSTPKLRYPLKSVKILILKFINKRHHRGLTS